MSATTISFIRTVISYILVVFALRIMGKRQVGELQPSELVVAIMISDLATIPMGDPALPLTSGVIPILTLISAEIAASLLSLKFPSIRKLLTGAPAIIIKNGKINREEMKKNRYNLEDLAEGLRMKDFFDISDVHTAILETNGSLSVIPMADGAPPSSKELGVAAAQQTLPHVIIADGKIYPEHLKEAGVDNSWVQKQLKSNNINGIKNVFILTVDDDKNVTIRAKE